MPADPRSRAAKGGCFVVADGFGGRRGGADASRLAGETVLAHYFQTPLTDTSAALGTALVAANQRVSEAGSRDPALAGMASTVVAAALRGGEAVIAHMGDSRAYLVRRQTVWPLTRDHSWVQEMLDGRVLTAQEAAHHPYRHVVTRYAGIGQPVMPDVRRVGLEPGDVLLLCSDGVSDRLPAPELGALAAGASAADPALAMTRQAEARGASDNASAVVIRYLPAPATRSSRRPAALPRSALSDESRLALAFGGGLLIGAATAGLILAALLT
jgi:protein phosphatase